MRTSALLHQRKHRPVDTLASCAARHHRLQLVARERVADRRSVRRDRERHADDDAVLANHRSARVTGTQARRQHEHISDDRLVAEQILAFGLHPLGHVERSGPQVTSAGMPVDRPPVTH